MQDIENHEIAVQMLMDQLIELGILAKRRNHRGWSPYVHGGEYYSESVVIDDEVVEKLKNVLLVPLHNPAHVMGFVPSVNYYQASLM